MKVVIFAGGMGTRISEESHLKPKPLIEIGGKPILWHIMKIYQKYGYNEFIICLGYRGYMIKEYFNNYYLHNTDVIIDTATGTLEYHQSEVDNFKVTLVNTGLETMTAGRLQKVRHHLAEGEDFLLTYGDGVSDIDIKALVDFHKAHNHIATVTTHQVTQQYGTMDISEEGVVRKFREKPKHSDTWINAGFFVMNEKIFDKYLVEDMTDIMWEQDPMLNMAKDGELMAYRHYGFWKSMDAMRDKAQLEEMWESGEAKWKIW